MWVAWANWRPDAAGHATRGRREMRHRGPRPAHCASIELADIGGQLDAGEHRCGHLGKRVLGVSCEEVSQVVVEPLPAGVNRPRGCRNTVCVKSRSEHAGVGQRIFDRVLDLVRCVVLPDQSRPEGALVGHVAHPFGARQRQERLT